VDFTRRVVPINGPLEAVWSPTSQRLYVSSSFGALHRLVQVDPVTLGVVQGPALGTASLQRLAITSDGGYLYAGSGSFVHRLALPGMTVDLSVPLGNFSASSPYVANDLRTIPGQPQSFVVARAWNGNHGGVFAYDNETPRPVSVPVNPAQTFEFARWLLPGATPDTFLSQSFGQSFPKVNNYEVLTLDANGIRVTSSTPSPYPFGTGRASRVGSKLYTLDGKVLDASDGALLSTLPGLGSTIPGALLADESRGRIYAWTQLNQKEVILVYDLATQTLLGNVPVYDGSFYTGGITIRSLAVWGSNGLALVDGERLTLLTGPMIAP
jgi:dipeptidyl aminopeptidase/acylaminoacyl peptidase